ncbi:MAG: tetratricopeptide repeat protein, partial [Pyrinomonadaceae bacterium]
MRRSTLSRQLIAATTNAERRRLLSQNKGLADHLLANEIRLICHASWTNDPVTAQRASSAMQILASLNDDEDVRAVAFWVKGISLITEAKFEPAVQALEDASKMLGHLGRCHDSAQTQMAKLLALAMLGRYDAAVEAGERALKIFLQNDDQVAAGKIEVNLSNVVARNGRHRAAKEYGLAARRRFVKTGNTELQAIAENGLANTYSELNDFEKADRYYRMALKTAISAGMLVTEAEIEASIGNLERIQGKYADALRSLELSRSKYESLNMPHHSAVADLEIADIYAELNLNAEALAIYPRVARDFRRLKMRAEEARACLNHGRCAHAAGDVKTSRKQLGRAFLLFTKENNSSGRLTATLGLSRLELEERDYASALKILRDAEPLLRKSENPRDRPAATWLEGEVNRQVGKFANATKKLSAAYSDAHRLRLPDLEQATLGSLGKLSNAQGDTGAAEKYFKKAIRLIEKLRVPLTAEEFSMGFLSSRLDPFKDLAELYLDTDRISDAFFAIESGRSRALIDSMDRGVRVSSQTNCELDRMRTELNSYYKRLDRADPGEAQKLRPAALKTEVKLSNLTRKIASMNGALQAGTNNARKNNLTTLRRLLGQRTTLVEYVKYRGKIAAFVISGGGRVGFVAGLALESEITALLDELHFQFGTFRYGIAGMKKFSDEIRDRTDRCLERLYDFLIAPLEEHISGERIVVVPTSSLHYVPFQALKGSGRYLIERFEISYSPSATVWSRLQNRKPFTMKKPLLVGFADERIPLVENEVNAIARLLPQAVSLVGDDASFSK